MIQAPITDLAAVHMVRAALRDVLEAWRRGTVTDDEVMQRVRAAWPATTQQQEGRA